MLAAVPWANGLGFSKGGHQVVGLAAFQRLKPATQQRVAALLRAHPRYQQDFAGTMPAGIAAAQQGTWLLVQASIWPDLARNFPEPDKKLYHRPGWHYINVPLFLTEADRQALEKSVKVNLNRYWTVQTPEAGMNAVQALDMIQKRFWKPGTTDADRAVMICWAAHLVGDLHQPLHTSALFARAQFGDGDEGGNKIMVKTARLGGEVGKLHGFWDGLLGYGPSFNDVQKRTNSALAVPAIVAQAEEGVKQMNVWTWVQEGSRHAAEYAYADEIRSALAAGGGGEANPVRLSNGYKSLAGEVARTRAVVGGYRLAQYLEGLLK